MLRKLLKFSVFSTESMLLVVFSLPLVELEDYTFQRFYAVPFIKNNVGSFIDVNSNLIIADRKFEKFTTVTNRERDANCIKTDKTWFCAKLNLMRTDRNSCLGAIIDENTEELQKLCTFKAIAIGNTVLVKTENSNTFLAYTGTPKSTKLFIKDSKKSLTFNGTQILSVNEEALLRINNFEVKFHANSKKTELELTITNNWPIELNDIDWKDSIKLPQPMKNVILNQDFSDLGKALNRRNLQEEILKKSLKKAL